MTPMHLLPFGKTASYFNMLELGELTHTPLWYFLDVHVLNDAVPYVKI